MYVRMYACIYVCMHACMQSIAVVCMYVRMYTYVCMRKEDGDYCCGGLAEERIGRKNRGGMLPVQGKMM